MDIFFKPERNYLSCCISNTLFMTRLKRHNSNFLYPSVTKIYIPSAHTINYSFMLTRSGGGMSF